MRKFGLIGYPLGHSFSKKYFTEKFHNECITDCSYENYPLTDLVNFRKLISEEPDLCGLNITIPYKSEIIRFLDIIESEAKEIGAVNVIKIKRVDGHLRLSGYNSDVTGIMDSLKPYLSAELRNVIVFGTGGSSRAVCFVLRKLGLNVTLVSRKKAPGVLDYAGLTSILIRNTGLIINTTPLGMFPNISSKPEIDYSLLTNKHILFDLVYNPELTSFLRMGMERGCTTISGLKMLHSQAGRAWQIWNDDNL
ncbi:MAG: shikimate dehydrogenase [Bacteroidetes bacterium]|nr:MAG: shikimate dehydrogenase [Bacteroidota bacterium]